MKSADTLTTISSQNITNNTIAQLVNDISTLQNSVNTNVSSTISSSLTTFIGKLILTQQTILKKYQKIHQHQRQLFLI